MATAKKAPAKKTKSVLSEGEIEALQDTLRERRKGSKDGLADVVAAIGKLNGLDRTLAQSLHELVIATAPQLAPKTWYGMPAYANDKDKVVCFFKPGEKFKSRYATFGFEDSAKLDDGNMWVTSFAVKKLDEADKKKLAALIKKAAG